MSRPPIARLLLLLALCAALPLSSAAAPRRGDADGQPPVLRSWSGPLAKRSGVVSAVIELADAPTTQSFAGARRAGLREDAAGATARTQLARIERAQQALLAPLRQRGATVLYRVQRAYNGIGVRVDASQLSAIAQLPGVKAIHPIVIKRPTNNGSVPLIGAPSVWTQTVGADKATGKGITVAVIDSGIDYIHKDFGGDGVYAGVTDTNPNGKFPSARVIAGYDFVGDAYDADSANPTINTPKPDANPVDCLSDPTTVGHGTHVAGTAAGGGVKADGTAYAGPYDASIYASPTFFKVAPGVAPEASLVALRVFGCDGSSAIVDQAIDWAVDPNGDGNPADHVAVINMSLGSDYGADYDSTSVASENAVAAGVVVVASAGNAGDSNYIHGSPGTADGVIAVAASDQPSVTLDGVAVTAGSVPAYGATLPAAFSAAYAWASKPDVTGAVYYPATNRTACADFSPGEAANIAGKVVVVDWTDGECGSVTRTAKVVAAGGIGALLVDNSVLFDLSITGSSVIPAVSMPKQVGDAIKANLTGLQVKFSGSLASSTTFAQPLASDVVASFTSRGPRRDGILKPDISAPGVNIYSALVQSGDKGQTLNGTSMAAPHVAGAMAILRQLHPDWSVAELKALAMNTATQNVRSNSDSDSQVDAPARSGAGRISLPNAAADSVIAFDAERPANVSVSFGSVEVVTTATVTRTVTLKNKGGAPATFLTSYTPVTTIPGVAYGVTPTQVTIPAGGTATVSVVMNATASQMRHTIDPTVDLTQGGLPREWISDASGHLALTAPAATTLFTANVRGYYENPPVDTPLAGTGVFTYTAATGNLDYRITFKTAATLTAGHIHRGPAGINGPVAVDLGASGSVTTLSGSTILGAADQALLLSGNLYVNFHTATNTGGELRGQVVPKSPALRLPVYAAARPASAMTAAAPAAFAAAPNLSADVAGTVALSGTGISGTPPATTQSLVSAFELQHVSPRKTAASDPQSYSDLRAVGISSSLAAGGDVATSTIYFGISTYRSWGSPNEPYFEVDIDTNKDGTADYALFTSNTGTSDPNDVFLTVLAKLKPDGSVDSSFGSGGYIDEYALNVLDSSQADTRPLGTNVIVLAVDAADLGLTSGAASFDYAVYSASNVEDNGGVADSTPTLTYDVTKPGIRFTGPIADTPTFADTPGTSIGVTISGSAYLANRSQGILLLHHHNVEGTRDEVLPYAFVFLPIVAK